MKDRIRIGISACLLGEKVRYDGGDRLARFLIESIGKYADWAPVCPETEYGLPAPREPMRLEGDPRSPCLVTIRSKTDHTEGMLKWAEKKIGAIPGIGLCGFVLKSRSPSCGLRGIKVYGPSGTPVSWGIGIFAAALRDRIPLLPVEDEEALADAAVRECFIGKTFAYKKQVDSLQAFRSLAEEGSFVPGAVLPDYKPKQPD